jgi:hypothetical protein
VSPKVLLFVGLSGDCQTSSRCYPTRCHQGVIYSLDDSSILPFVIRDVINSSVCNLVWTIGRVTLSTRRIHPIVQQYFVVIDLCVCHRYCRRKSFLLRHIEKHHSTKYMLLPIRRTHRLDRSRYLTQRIDGPGPTSDRQKWRTTDGPLEALRSPKPLFLGPDFNVRLKSSE